MSFSIHFPACSSRQNQCTLGTRLCQLLWNPSSCRLQRSTHLWETPRRRRNPFRQKFNSCHGVIWSTQLRSAFVTNLGSSKEWNSCHSPVLTSNEWHLLKNCVSIASTPPQMVGLGWGANVQTYSGQKLPQPNAIWIALWPIDFPAFTGNHRTCAPPPRRPQSQSRAWHYWAWGRTGHSLVWNIYIYFTIFNINSTM